MASYSAVKKHIAALLIEHPQERIERTEIRRRVPGADRKQVKGALHEFELCGWIRREGDRAVLITDPDGLRTVVTPKTKPARGESGGELFERLAPRGQWETP